MKPNISEPVNSVLVVKASGSLDHTEDMNLPEGKSIAQLLYEKEKNVTTK